MKVKKAIKKIAALCVGATMLGATLMGASALTDLSQYPGEMVENGVFVGKIVLGGPDVKATDVRGSTMLAGAMAGETVIQEVIEGGYLFETDTNILEFSEVLTSITTLIEDDDLGVLSGGEVGTSKGTAKYDEYFRFVGTPSTEVVFEESDDDEEFTGLHLKFYDNEVFLQYEVDFTSSLDSDVDTNDDLEDIEDKQITLLGKTYTFVQTDNSTAELVLMGGEVSDMIDEGETKTYTLGGQDFTVTLQSVTESGTTEYARFYVEGELTSALADGDTFTLEDGSVIGVTDIVEQGFAGGIRSAKFYLGADKLTLQDGQAFEVNDDSIAGSRVDMTITRPTGDEFNLEGFTVNMTAQDNYYVPIGGKLSENPNLDEPELLFAQTWDFEFLGTSEEATNDIRLKSVSGEEGYDMTFTNTKGIEVGFDLAYDGASTVANGHFGDKDEVLHIAAASATNPYVEDEWFILGTDNDADTVSYVVQYKGHDINTTDDPQLYLNVVGVDSNKEVSLSGTTGTFTLGGKQFTVTINNAGVRDSNITSITGPTWNKNELWTEYGAKIVLQDELLRAACPARLTTASVFYTGANGTCNPGRMLVNITEADTDRMDDYAGGVLVAYNISATSNELDISKIDGINLIESEDDEDINEGYSVYGAHVLEDTGDTSTSTSVTIEYPETQLAMKVALTAEGTVTRSVATGSSGTAYVPPSNIVYAADITDNSAQPMIVVGGPCANAVASDLLGNPADCTEGFDPGVGRVILFPDTGAGHSAILVAGYYGADTEEASLGLAEGRATGLETTFTKTGTGSTAEQVR